MGLLQSMIVGTAGHIDHGKTTLVRALTGVDTDRLKEEKARGISIELGYAYTALPGGEVLGFVDVPGHERLVHTMVAGVGGIDYVLLVIAADDGVMPQTREHLAILELLGITCGAVALSKIDRVDDARVREVRAQIATLLAATGLEDAPLFPVAATLADDAGVNLLRAHLHSTAVNWPRRTEDGLFRLAIDRVFTLPGRGTVATGTARAGQVQVGDTLAVMPAGLEARVRSIHAQNRDSGTGRAGERCALNLVGIERTGLARGDWLADPRAFVPTTRIDVHLRRLGVGAAMRDREPLHIHLGTAHRVAHVVLLEAEAPGAGASSRVQLVFDRPVCATTGDAFIARDIQARHTIGGGVVIDPCAPARRRRSLERLAYLESIEHLCRGGGIEHLLRNAPHGIAMSELVRLCSRAPERIGLPASVRMIDAGGERFLFHGSQWQSLSERALNALRTFHVQNPDEPGVDRGRLRRITAPHLVDAVWRAVVDELVQKRAMRCNKHWLHLPEHRIALSDSEQRLAQKLFATIAAGRFDPPWVRDLAATTRAPDAEVRRVLRKGMAQGEVYEIVRDLYYHRDSVGELSRVLKALRDQHGVVQSAQYRDAIGVGRKRTIQILEFFDRVGYTRRSRDTRTLRADSGWYDES
jgi:selenocysteine-specific elongation factor